MTEQRDWVADAAQGIKAILKEALLDPCNRADELDIADFAPIIRSAHAASITPPACWLIERSQPEGETGCYWWSGMLAARHEAAWTTDASAATRFSRKQDAEQIIGAMMNLRYCHAAEHIFLEAK